MNKNEDDKGIEAIIHNLKVIYGYLRENEIPKSDDLMMNKRLYNNYNSKRRQEIKVMYEKMKAEAPMKFKHKKGLGELRELIFLMNKKDIIVPFVIPSGEMDYINELTIKDIILFYKREYSKKNKSKKDEQLISYIFKSDNWTKYLYPCLLKTRFHQSKNVKELIDYINKNYLRIKANIYLQNYEIYLNKK